MATFTSIRVAYRPLRHQVNKTAEIRPRYGHLVWITLPDTGERHRVLVSTGSHNQSVNVSLAISGHSICHIRGDDMLGRADWRRYPQQVAQASINRICRHAGGLLVADTLRQSTVHGPVLNPEYLGGR